MSEIKPARRPRPAPLRLTPSAVARLKTIMEAEADPELKLRVSVSGGGCSGFQYGFALEKDRAMGDEAVEIDGVTVLVDNMSLMFVLGAELDFVEDLTGSFFRMNNPNASSACSCGSSFAL